MWRSDLVFFGSGVAALVYQTVWARLLARLLGSGASGTALVLGVFMGGMALGALIGGRLARRTRRPVHLFVAIEVTLAAWAASSPHLLAWIEPVGGIVPRALVASLALLGPTMLMGATFPLMGRLMIARGDETARATSAFYGANTVGAAVGALVGPFVLMPSLGLSGALYAAAALELVVAALARVWLRAPSAPDAAHVGARVPGLVCNRFVLGAAAMGASALALEVLLTRTLVTVTGASIYAFAIVLAVFLAGIGLGSRWLEARAEDDAADHERRFVRAALAVAPLTLLGLAVLGWRLDERDLFGGLTNRMPGGASVVRLWIGHATWAALALLAPALAFGRALPSAVAAAVARRPNAPRESVLGVVYGANTVGALLGALGAGFWLLPAVGPRVALLVALGAALAGALVAGGGRRRGETMLALAATALLAGLVLTPAGGDARRLTLGHGPHATVSVEESGDGAQAVRALRVNGKVVATSGSVDLRLQRLLAAIPAHLHGDVQSALVIGLGTGMTAGALLDVPSLEAVRVVEISSVVPTHGAAPFARWNRNLLDDARVDVVHADGRHYLARTEERFDLVTSDPIHPWTAGSSDLYAVEHFERMAARLAPGGVASQWLPLYQLSNEDVRTVIASWVAAFPHTSAWLTAYDIALVGAVDRLDGPADLAARALSSAVAESLAEAGVHSAAELAALFVGDDAALRAFAAGTPPMHDDRPVLEFRAPRSYLAGYSVEALRWAGRAAPLVGLPPAAAARGREVRELLAAFLEQLPSGWTEAARRYGEALLALPPL